MVKIFYISDERRKYAKNSDIRFYLVKSLIRYQKVGKKIRHLSGTRRIQPMLQNNYKKLWVKSCMYSWKTHVVCGI